MLKLCDLAYGDHHIVISSPSGGVGYDVLIDSYYYGSIVEYTTGWTVFIKPSVLTQDDIDAILDRITS